ncbi:MAG TPA: antibiotic biosynthesis monooxygenase [Gemmatimonadaceae bacterium]|nr:antibiotic biosynthesis monooxygenase [Gemmatimonadaceae bacterium]
MYAVIRRYNIAPGSAASIAQKVNTELLPSLGQMPGFGAYYAIDPADGTMVSVSIFESREEADASTKAATDWVRQNLGSMIKTAPVIISGTIVAHAGEGAARHA